MGDRVVGVGFVFALVGVLAALWGAAAVGVYGQDMASDEDRLTRAYVEGAWEYYVDRGLGRTVERYGNPLSWDGERYLLVADARTRVLVSSPLLYLNGRGRIDEFGPGASFSDELARATDMGHWFDATGLNMLTGQREAARYFVVVRDGLLFMSARFSGGLDAPPPAPPPQAPVERRWPGHRPLQCGPARAR